MQPQHLRFLDGLRGLAAVWVVLCHARWLLWEGYSGGYALHPQRYSLLGRAPVYLFSVFRNGHAAVIFFFVLSGFVIHLRYSRNLARSGSLAFDAAGYLYRRARRLYPPLLFALLLTYALDMCGKAAGLPIYAAEGAGSSLPAGLMAPMSWAHTGPVHDAPALLANLTFMMTAPAPVWGSNCPLWSLHYEWWFYMLYPAFLVCSQRSIPVATAAICALFAAGFEPGLWGGLFLRGIFSMMLCWWLGVLLADVCTGRIRIPYSRVALLLAAAPAAPFVRNPAVADLLTALAMTGGIAACFRLLETGRSLRLLERLGGLGDISYSLYVIHFPIFVFLSGWLIRRSPGHRLPMHSGWIVLGTAIVLSVAYVAHLLVEKPFTGSRRRRSAMRAEEKTIHESPSAGQLSGRPAV
jgi:peptidoglycan/LPS O-acetylase OafA/YrhL